MNSKPIYIVADENISGLEPFEKLGILEKINGRAFTPELVSKADALLIRSVTKIDSNLLKKSNVKFIASATSGIDHVDLNYLQQNDVHFAYAPGSNAMSVVQYFFSSLAYLSNKYQMDWRELRFGIVGAGNIGALLAEVLQNLELPFLIYDPFLDSSHRFAERMTDFETVMKQDLVTIHTPLTRATAHPTFHFIDQNVLDGLTKDTFIINAARGGVIDNQALLETIKKSPYLKCVLDVWENEPNINLDLLKKVDIGSSHIAGYSFEGKEKGTAQIYDSFVKYYQIPDARPYPINTEQAELNLDLPEDALAQINLTILSAYNVSEDSKKLMQVLRTGDESGVSFDKLRKEYAYRREFSYFCLDYSAYHPKAANLLKTLGFS